MVSFSKCILFTILGVIVFFIVFHKDEMANTYLAKEDNFDANGTYIVVSSDLNLYYLVHLPIVVQYWKNFGIGAIVLITLNENDKIEKDPAAMKVLAYLRELDAHIEYFHNKTIKTGQFSQTARNFAAGTKFAQKLSPDAVLITTDVDFFPMRINSHLPDKAAGKEIMFYDYACCGHIEWKGLWYRMYIMITIGMTVQRWREVIEIPIEHPIDGTFIDDMVNKTFDNSISQQEIFWQWFLDQRFFGIKFHYWQTHHRKDARRVVQKLVRKGQPRLERHHWPSEKEMETLNLARYESIHLSPGVFMDPIWKNNLPVYQKLFEKEQMDRLIQYREDVVKVMDPREIEETRKKHYHPEQNDKYWNATFGQKTMMAS